jgi:hypothetical protein
MEQSPLWEDNSHSVKTFRTFYGNEGLLMCSQQSATSPYAEHCLQKHED